MTKGEFSRHQEILFDKLRDLREAGQKEYAHDEENAFRNFEAVGRDIEIDRKKALWVYLKKHLDGIKAHLNGHVSQRESVHGRIQDAIVYLMLLDGMIVEDETRLLRETTIQPFDKNEQIRNVARVEEDLPF